jgi:hypothetical protein
LSTLAVNAVTDANGGNTATINSMTPTADSLQGFRNRIINGDMRIDQRNAGAAVTTTNSYPVDRFQIANTTDGAFSAQQDSSAPAGFTNSIKFTTTTADGSLTTTQRYGVNEKIEGFNVADLGWGAVGAKSITVSFWVRSSLTGTFGGSVSNNDIDRSYPFSYTISVADTWEYKTVTIPGDTTGTWLNNNGIGIRLEFSLGAGPDRSGTAGVWANAFYTNATGATNVMGTLNATWYITGVQFEVGSVATPFERRPYGTELALCQRYFETSYNAGTAVPTNTDSGAIWFCPTGSRLIYSYPFKVTKRASPTTVFYSTADSATGNYRNDTGATNVAVGTGGITGTNFLYMYKSSGATDQTECNVHFSASAEL